MLGKLATVHTLVRAVRRARISNYCVTPLVQGHTKRWAVAWSFRGSRAPDAVARGVPDLAPPPCTLSRAFPRLVDDAGATCSVHAFLLALPTLPQEHAVVHAPRTADGAECVAVDLYTACWTRGARRKRARLETDQAAHGARPLLAIEASFARGALHVRWTYGHDRVTYASCAEHLFHQLALRLRATTAAA